MKGLGGRGARLPAAPLVAAVSPLPVVPVGPPLLTLLHAAVASTQAPSSTLVWSRLPSTGFLIAARALGALSDPLGDREALPGPPRGLPRPEARAPVLYPLVGHALEARG